jgi:hypothetical protein
MIEIEAIDIFIETDAEGGGEEGPSLIAVRVPYDREFARQIRELGAKWDDQTKEWRLYGTEELVKQVAELCKAVFPRLPRRRNRLVAAQLSTELGNSLQNEIEPESSQVELVGRVQFVVNRTLKNYRVGQNLKWHKEFKQIVVLAETERASGLATQQKQYASQLKPSLPDLERVATAAFEALLAGQKDAAKAILGEAGIQAS